MLKLIARGAARRTFSSQSAAYSRLRIGFVPGMLLCMGFNFCKELILCPNPEHFSTPLYFAQKYFDLNAELIPFPSGTGHMIQSLRGSEIDVGIGLTEGWVAGLGKGKGYKLIGTYVESPLCWAISTGLKNNLNGVEQLKGKKIGVSRIGR
jgi:hypothetical protein